MGRFLALIHLPGFLTRQPRLYRLDTLCGRAPKFRRFCWRKNVGKGESHGPKSVKPSPPCISLLWDDAPGRVETADRVPAGVGDEIEVAYKAGRVETADRVPAGVDEGAVAVEGKSKISDATGGGEGVVGLDSVIA